MISLRGRQRAKVEDLEAKQILKPCTVGEWLHHYCHHSLYNSVTLSDSKLELGIGTQYL